MRGSVTHESDSIIITAVLINNPQQLITCETRCSMSWLLIMTCEHVCAHISVWAYQKGRCFEWPWLSNTVMAVACNFFLANRSMKHSADSSVVKPPLDGSPSLDAPEYNNSKQYVNIVK